MTSGSAGTSPRPVLTETDRADLTAALTAVDEQIDRMNRAVLAATTPIIEGQRDFTRTMTTLSSGALLLSTSLTQIVGPRLVNARLSILLPISWVVFGGLIALAAFRVPWLQESQIHITLVESARADAHQFIYGRPTQEQVFEYIDTKIDAAFGDAGRRASAQHRRLDRSQQIAAWAFAVGMLALVVFAIGNLPGW